MTRGGRTPWDPLRPLYRILPDTGSRADIGPSRHERTREAPVSSFRPGMIGCPGSVDMDAGDVSVPPQAAAIDRFGQAATKVGPERDLADVRCG